MLLFNWTARRAGAGMTVNGRDSGDAPAKITGVEKITARAGRVFAVDATGDEHELVLA